MGDPNDPNAVSKMLRWLRISVRLGLILFNNVYGVFSYVMWMVLLRPLLWWDVTRPFYNWLDGLQFRGLLLMVDYWAWSAGYTIIEVGDVISEKIHTPSLWICNHQSTADVPMIMSVISHSRMSESVFWIMDVMFKYTHFGLVSQIRGDYFILQGKETRSSQLSSLQQHLLDNFDFRQRTSTILFPEGGFLYKRREKSKEYAKKHGYPVLEHVTLPRIGAMQTILKTLTSTKEGDQTVSKSKRTNGDLASNGVGTGHNLQSQKDKTSIKWIVDVTLAYPEGRAYDLLSILGGMGKPGPTYVHYRCYPASEVPTDSDELLQWMYKRFTKKEEILEAYYKTGVMPGSENGKVRKQVTNTWLIWTILTLSFLSAVFHFYLIRNFVSLLLSFIPW